MAGYRSKLAVPRIVSRRGMPTFWTYGEGPRKTFTGDTGDVADLARSASSLTRGSGVVWGPGQRGQSLTFAGTAGATGSGVVLPTLSAFTLTATVFIPSASDSGCFLKLGNGSNGVGLGVGLGMFTNIGNNLIVLQESIAWHDSGVAIGTGWADVAVSAAAGGLSFSFWINGIKVAGFTTGTSAPTSDGSIAVGASTGSSGRNFTGQISDARFYPRELTVGEQARNHFDPDWRLRPRRRVWLGTSAPTVAHNLALMGLGR
jgi:hypothetical protein